MAVSRPVLTALLAGVGSLVLLADVAGRSRASPASARDRRCRDWPAADHRAQAAAWRRAAAGRGAGDALRAGLSALGRSCSACRTRPTRRWRWCGALRARFPDCDIALVVDRTAARRQPQGRQPDQHAARGAARRPGDRRLRRACAARTTWAADRHGAGRAGVGCRHHALCRAARRPVAGQPAAAPAQITHGFLPGALLARALGRQDCLGATMACGGHAGADRRLCRRWWITWPTTTCSAGGSAQPGLPDRRWPHTVAGDHGAGTHAAAALFRHELRWARTIRALAPAASPPRSLQYPLAWALLTVVLVRRRDLGALAVVLAAWRGRGQRAAAMA